MSCQQKVLDTKSAAFLFLERCLHMFGSPKWFVSDIASITDSEDLKQLFPMSRMEQHSSVAYGPQSNRRAERAVQTVVNSRR